MGRKCTIGVVRQVCRRDELGGSRQVAVVVAVSRRYVGRGGCVTGVDS